MDGRDESERGIKSFEEARKGPIPLGNPCGVIVRAHFKLSTMLG